MNAADCLALNYSNATSPGHIVYVVCFRRKMGVWICSEVLSTRSNYTERESDKVWTWTYDDRISSWALVVFSGFVPSHPIHHTPRIWYLLILFFRDHIYPLLPYIFWGCGWVWVCVYTTLHKFGVFWCYSSGVMSIHSIHKLFLVCVCVFYYKVLWAATLSCVEDGCHASALCCCCYYYY